MSGLPTGHQAAPSVWLVEDDVYVRGALSDLLASAGFSVSPHAGARDFLDSFVEGSRGCLLLDIGLPGEDGLALMRRAVPSPVDVPVIIVSGLVDVDSAVVAMQLGAASVLRKPFEPSALLSTVSRLIDADAAAWGLRRERVELRAALATLTEREREVLSYVVRGRTSAEVAQALGISHRTVEVHRSRILQKTRMERVTELVYEVMRLNLLDHPGS